MRTVIRGQGLGMSNVTYRHGERERVRCEGRPATARRSYTKVPSRMYTRAMSAGCITSLRRPRVLLDTISPARRVRVRLHVLCFHRFQMDDSRSVAVRVRIHYEQTVRVRGSTCVQHHRDYEDDAARVNKYTGTPVQYEQLVRVSVCRAHQEAGNTKEHSHTLVHYEQTV